MTPPRGELLLVLSLLCCGNGCGDSPSNASSQSTATAKQGAAETTATTADKSFDDMKFEMEPTEQFQKDMLTPEIEELFGNRIRIRGYIYPTLKKRGLKQFVLVRDNLECCFGPGAALYDCILVHMQPGKSTEYSIYPVAVEGVLRFEEFLDPDGKVRAIYRLDGDAVN